MNLNQIKKSLLCATLGMALSACGLTSGGNTQVQIAGKKTIEQRVADKSYPAVFQAWNPLDMPSKYPTDTHEQFLDNAAKHSLIWEEPVSQLGFDTKLVFGLVWDHKHAGLATSFTKESLAEAKKNLTYLLDKNPNIVSLFEVRWRDAPGSYLPENSEFWLRDAQGNRVQGWNAAAQSRTICSTIKMKHSKNV